MFNHHINTLHCQDLIFIGSTFSHYHKGNKETHSYLIVSIILSDNKLKNDSILLQSLLEGSIMQVETEWFNQRNVKFHESINV